METKKKVFTAAPLPFMGQKRKFLKQFKPALEHIRLMQLMLIYLGVVGF